MVVRSFFRRILLIAIAFSMICAAACTKANKHSTDAANDVVIDSQIPPGLSPQYFPPTGFVWSSFKSDRLPAARYGVAAPSTHPQADIVIIADAGYPAEGYFGLARELIAHNYTVWIFEPPGQGGAGRYFLQGEKIHTPDFNHGTQSVQDFIDSVIRPVDNRSIYIVGIGTGALTALDLDGKSLHVPAGIIAYAPYLSPPQQNPAIWRGQDMPPDGWARIAHKWQKANPDLRLRAVSESWVNEMNKAAKRFKMTRNAPRRMIVTTPDISGENANKIERLCDRAANCSVKSHVKYDELSKEINAFIKRSAPPATTP